MPQYHPNFKDEQGKLAPYAWPGGYLVEWLTDEGDSLCADCATKAEDEDGTEVAPFVHEAGSQGFTCEECGEEKR